MTCKQMKNIINLLDYKKDNRRPAIPNISKDLSEQELPNMTGMSPVNTNTSANNLASCS